MTRDTGMNRESPAVQIKLDAALKAYQEGRLDAARKGAEALVQRSTPPAMALFLLGAIHSREGDAGSAAARMAEAVETAPEVPLYRTTLATVLLSLDRRGEAGVHLAEAVRLNPDDVASRLSLADALRRQGRTAEALDHADAALRLAPAEPAGHKQRAVALRDLGRVDEAAASLDRALELAPGDIESLSVAAMLRRSRGDRDGAVELFRRARAVDPGNGLAALHLGEMAPDSATPPDDLERHATEATRPDRERNLLYLAAGNAHERRGDPGRAFAAWREANRARGRYADLGFSLDAVREYGDWARATFTPEWFAVREDFGVSDERPLFVVGMPRSGTTLIERTVAAHPEAHGAGELPHVTVLRRAATGEDRGADVARGAETLNADAVADAARRYLAALSELGDTAEVVVDKMPHNFEHLWFIALMFPGAKVVHARRSPLDTCVSCFATDFDQAHGYRNDAATLGAYYREYRRLMDHWTEVLPLTFLDVQYEDLVRDQETGSRRLIEFAGLDWDDACLDLAGADGTVLTASATQVRREVSTRSVGRWLKYRDHMGDLIEALGPELTAESERLGNG